MEAVLHKKSNSPKREEVKDAVRDRARKLGPGAKLPTVVELCQSLGVAKATLNSALDGLQAEGVLQRKRGSGIYVSPRIAQKNVALVLGSNIFAAGASPFYGQLIQRCEQRAKSHCENFSFYLDMPQAQVDDHELPVHRDLAEDIESGKLHGILLASRNSEEEETWLRSQRVPVVSLTTEEQPCAIRFDYEELVRLGVKALADQGCRQIGFVSPLLHNDPDGAFYHAGGPAFFAAELGRLGLHSQPNWMWWPQGLIYNPSVTRERDCGYRSIKEMFADGAGPRPDGLVILDDMLTRGALEAMRESGLVVGRDLKIATHANKGSPALREYETALTLVEVDPSDIADAMFEKLEKLMAGDVEAEKSILIKPKIRRTIDVSANSAAKNSTSNTGEMP